MSEFTNAFNGMMNQRLAKRQLQMNEEEQAYKQKMEAVKQYGLEGADLFQKYMAGQGDQPAWEVSPRHEPAKPSLLDRIKGWFGDQSQHPGLDRPRSFGIPSPAASPAAQAQTAPAAPVEPAPEEASVGPAYEASAPPSEPAPRTVLSMLRHTRDQRALGQTRAGEAAARQKAMPSYTSAMAGRSPVEAGKAYDVMSQSPEYDVDEYGNVTSKAPDYRVDPAEIEPSRLLIKQASSRTNPDRMAAEAMTEAGKMLRFPIEMQTRLAAAVQANPTRWEALDNADVFREYIARIAPAAQVSPDVAAQYLTTLRQHLGSSGSGPQLRSPPPQRGGTDGNGTLSPYDQALRDRASGKSPSGKAKGKKPPIVPANKKPTRSAAEVAKELEGL